MSTPNTNRPIVQIPTVVTPERLHEIADSMEQGVSHDARLMRVGRFLEFPAYPLRIDFVDELVWSNDRYELITKRESGLLNFMATNADVEFRTEEIYEKVWGMKMLGAKNLITVHISNIGRKIEKNLGVPRPIRNIRGVGFIFDSVPRKIE